jgi:hypothetical protein
MIAFFGSFQEALQERQLTVKGITTDGSALYPTAIQVVWGDLPHQICASHILIRPESGDFAGNRSGAQATCRPTTEIEAWMPKGRPEETGAKTPAFTTKNL